MKFRLYTTITFLLGLNINLVAQNWQKIISPLYDENISLSVTHNYRSFGSISVGSHDAGINNGYFLALDGNGAIKLQSKVSDLGDSLSIYFSDVDIDHNQNIYLGGGIDNRLDGILIKLDHDGHEISSKSFLTRFYGNSTSHCVDLETGDSGIYAVFGRYNLAHFDFDLNLMWNKSIYILGTEMIIKSIENTRLNNLYVGGNVYSGDYILKLNSKGDTIWTHSFSNWPGYSFNLDFLCSFHDESVLAISSMPQSFFLYKLDKNGKKLWSTWIQKDNNHYLNVKSVTESENGSFIVAGDIQNFMDFDFDMFIINFDSSGIINWSNQYGTDTIDITSGLIVDSIGDMQLLGVSKAGRGINSDIMVVKTDSGGRSVCGENSLLLKQVSFSVSEGYIDSLSDSPLFIDTLLIDNNELKSYDSLLCDTITDKISKHETMSQLMIFPNPIDEVLNIKLDNIVSEIKATLYSLQGQKVEEWAFFNSQMVELNINCEKGMYLLKIQTNGQEYSRLVIKQ